MNRAALLAGCLGCATLLAADQAPQWVRDAASAAVPKYEAKVPAVILLDEQRVTVDDSGQRTITSRRAIKVLSNEGRDEAYGVEHYRTGSSKVTDLHAWLISPAAQVKQFGKDRIVDVAAVNNDIYSDVRARVVSASEATSGSVFAYEAVSEDKSIVTQFEWEFQDRLPVLASRFALTVPAGWRVDSVTFNSAKLEPAIAGTTYTWELKDLPFIDPEPSGPAASGLAPRIGVTFFPPSAVKNAGSAFASWKDVSVFQFGLAEGQQASSNEMIAKTRELTGGAKAEFDKIAPVGRFVQAINYIAVATNVGRGGGYRPHTATDVFAKSYGDCKDKANLMGAMLKIAGIESYLTAIYAGDRTYVRPEWPSPHQFNHMILAVKVSEAVTAPAVLVHPELGRLLFFDPTDDSIPPGYLPSHEQDSHALVIADAKGALVRMPVTPPEANRVERESEIALGPDGAARIRVTEHSFGETAASSGYRHARATADEYKRVIERWVSQSGAGRKIERVEGAPAGANEFKLTVKYSAAGFGQTMQERLMMVKMLPAPFRAPSFPETRRKYPVLLESELESETVKMTVPEGFAVDELPDPVKLETPFGGYTATYSMDAGAVMAKRALEVRAGTVTVERYGELRTFFSRVLGNVQAPVVLVKK